MNKHNLLIKKIKQRFLSINDLIDSVPIGLESPSSDFKAEPLITGILSPSKS